MRANNRLQTLKNDVNSLYGFWRDGTIGSKKGSSTIKTRKVNLSIDLSFCGCQDSNLEQYIDRMCHIIIKKSFMAHSLANGFAHLLTKAPVSRLIVIKQKKTTCLSQIAFFLRVPGLEPGAFWFVAKRSIQLGYIRLIDGPKIV